MKARDGNPMAARAGGLRVPAGHRWRLVIASLALLGVAVAPAGRAGADADSALPPGPIRDRHDLMEQIGKNAKAIGAAAKAGTPAAMVDPARAIASAAARVPGLFPAGSTHPESRAKPEIWQQFSDFERDARDLGERATTLAAAAARGADVGGDVRALMGACKTCHDAFRLPKDDEK